MENYILIEESKLKQLLKKIVRTAVGDALHQVKSYPDWVTKKQALEILNKKSPVTIDNYVKKGLIRRQYKAGKPYFSLKDLRQLKSNRF